VVAAGRTDGMCANSRASEFVQPLSSCSSMCWRTLLSNIFKDWDDHDDVYSKGTDRIPRIYTVL